MDLDRPYPADWTVRRARDAYLAENGFTLEGYDAKWTEGAFLGIRMWVPNTARHRWAIMLHDLHHVATGYGTDALGEAEISAWELARRPWRLGPYVGSLVLFGALFGLVIGPQRTIAAWRASRRGPSLYAADLASLGYEELLDMTVGELRAMLGVPTHGVADRLRSRHVNAPRRADVPLDAA